MTDAIPANFSIVTLGVVDLERSARFYRDLGWEQRREISDGICWFKTSGTWVGLYGYEALGEDAELVAPASDSQPRYRGITLAVNLPTEAEVDNAFARAAEAGAEIVKPAKHTAWGGYSGYFADPDGHLWELCRNPGFPIDERGRIEIP